MSFCYSENLSCGQIGDKKRICSVGVAEPLTGLDVTGATAAACNTLFPGTRWSL